MSERAQESYALNLRRRLAFLTPKQIEMIDELVGSLGPFGEIELIVEDGSLRAVASTHSFDALKWPDEGNTER